MIYTFISFINLFLLTKRLNKAEIIIFLKKKRMHMMLPSLSLAAAVCLLLWCLLYGSCMKEADISKIYRKNIIWSSNSPHILAAIHLLP